MTEDIQKACEIMQAGGIILYPTDTIWGIGCDATNEKAVQKVYELKKRTDNKAMLDRQFSKAEHVCVGYARYSLGPDRSGR